MKERILTGEVGRRAARRMSMFDQSFVELSQLETDVYSGQ